MRILVVSYFFPPYNVIGAVRVGRFARELARMGHEVRVLSAANQPFPATLRMDLEGIQVVRTRWLDLYAPARVAAQRAIGVGTAAPSSAPAANGTRPPLLSRAARALRRSAAAVANLPDPEAGWYPFALRAGRKLVREWRPDVIYASAKPFTGLFVADALARRAGVPWVGELRDLWVDNHYRAFPAWRDRLERGMEDRLLRRAAGLVSVSEPMAEHLHQRHGVPAQVVYTGFEPAAADAPAPPADGTLDILYTGNIYPGKRDPTPLVRALAELGPLARRVTVRMYGSRLEASLAPALALARELGVADRLRLHDPVSHDESVRMQHAASILLLLTWDNPEERGTVAGKLFEYLGARRPILSMGCTDGVVARLIHDRGLGVCSNDPAAIAEWLRARLAESEAGGVAPFDAEGVADLSLAGQSRALADFLARAARDGGKKSLAESVRSD